MTGRTAAERLAAVETGLKHHLIADDKAHAQNTAEHKAMSGKLNGIYRNTLISLGSVITLLITFAVSRLTQ